MVSQKTVAQKRDKKPKSRGKKAITLKNRIIIMNFNFLNKFLNEILLTNVNTNIAINITVKIIKLSTAKIKMVSKIRKIILEMLLHYEIWRNYLMRKLEEY